MARRVDVGWQPVAANGDRLYFYRTRQVWMPVNPVLRPVTYRWEWLADLRAAVRQK